MPNVGIGTTVPGTLLDVAGAITSRPSGTGAGQTGQIMMRELAASGTNTYTLKAPDALTADRSLTFPDSNGSSGQVLSTNGSGVLSWVSALTSTTGFVQDGNSFSATATLGTNDAQHLILETAGTPRVVISGTNGTTSVTSANLALGSGTSNFAIFSSDTQAADVGGSLGFGGQDGGTPDRTFARISGRKTNSTSGNYDGYLAFETRANGSLPAEHMRITSAGNVGIGTNNPSVKLDVTGSVRVSSGQISAASYNAAAGTSFDFNNGNIQYTTAACQAMTLSNMQDGGSYSVNVKNTSGTCSFTHTGLTLKYAGGVSNVTITAHTVFTFLRVGTDLYVTWVSF